MSHVIDETYDVYNETERRARKEYQCAACAEKIRVGDIYHAIAIIDRNGFESLKRCVRCQAIHEHLRDIGDGDTWPDERLACGEEYEAHWGGPPPEDIAALAFATPDEMQRRKP